MNDFGVLAICGIHHIGRKQDAAVVIRLESMVQQALAHRLATNLHAGLGHDAFGLGEDLANLLVGKNVQCRSHR